jgi:hypothetical protein
VLHREPDGRRCFVQGGRLTTRGELDGHRSNAVDGRLTIHDEVHRCCVLGALGSIRDALGGRRLNVQGVPGSTRGELDGRRCCVLGGRLTTRDVQDGRRLNVVRDRRGLGHGRQSHRDLLDDRHEETSHERCLGDHRGFRVGHRQSRDVSALLRCSVACAPLRRVARRLSAVVLGLRGHLRVV